MSKEKILVIGGAGFIGSNLVNQLLHDYQIYVVDNFTTGSWNNCNENAKYFEGEAGNIDQIFRKEKFQYVFHLGEYSRVEQSFNEIDACIQNNLSNFPRVLSYCNKHGSKLIYSASSTVFADVKDDECLSPYTLSKQQNVDVLRQYSKWTGLQHAIVYFYNVYGPNELSQGKYATVVGKFLQMIKSGETLLPVTSPGSQRRNFTHVNDIVKALQLIAEQGYGDGYMIGAKKDYSIIELANMLEAEYRLTPAVAGNRIKTTIDTSKVEALGWSAKINLLDYLRSELLKN